MYLKHQVQALIQGLLPVMIPTPSPNPCLKQVNHDVFHRMLKDYRDAKLQEKEMTLKTKQ